MFVKDCEQQKRCSLHHESCLRCQCAAPWTALPRLPPCMRDRLGSSSCVASRRFADHRPSTIDFRTVATSTTHVSGLTAPSSNSAADNSLSPLKDSAAAVTAVAAAASVLPRTLLSLPFSVRLDPTLRARCFAYNGAGLFLVSAFPILQMGFPSETRNFLELSNRKPGAGDGGKSRAPSFELGWKRARNA